MIGCFHHSIESRHCQPEIARKLRAAGIEADLNVYESFSQNKSFELSAGEGEKILYARFLFADGAETGELITDNIRLDLKAEIDSVYFAPAGPFVAFDTVVFTVETTEAGGTASVSIEGAGTVDLAVFTNGYLWHNNLM